MIFFFQFRVAVHDSLRSIVGIIHRYAQHFKNVRNGCFTGTDAAGETDLKNGRRWHIK